MLSAPFGDLPYKDQAEYAAAGSFVNGAGASAVVDVIIMLGANDSKNFNWAPSGKAKNDQQFLKDYRAMVEHFSALTPKPLVFLALPLATGNSPCCSIDGRVIHEEILPLIKQLAAEKNLPTIDLNTPTTGHPEYFGDGVHPTDAGYAVVAGLMHDGLLIDRGSAGATGAGGLSASGGSAGGGGASSGGASSGGGSDLVTAGSAGSPQGGSAAPTVAGAASAGTPQNAGTNSGVAGSGASAGGKSGLPAHSDDRGCAVSGSARAARSLPAFGLLGLGWLLARRRRARG